ncbi:histidine kinase [Lentilactobacillus otakiensis]|uniref:histidine kinase n=1 Tax=Lentilactobacillus otakiensis DSM 19908 = JCM 15040 TaxID=1423780 RepID=S4PMW2_9LACO|nr:histidine kinase [Lentilactobacillus otakiensis]GAD15550.1 multi-sensor signal transduction histidine kinase [Lentilactobacillus otakiensis DSM 19908 = JCM 15040]
MMLSKIYKQILTVVILSIAALAMLFCGFMTKDDGWVDLAGLLLFADASACIVLMLEYRQHDKLLKQLQVMTANIVDHQPAAPLFVEPDNPLKGVADQLNELQSRQQDEGKSIRNSNAELITILSSLPVGVMVIDSTHDVIFANHKMSVMLGRDILTQVHPYTQDIRNYQLLSLIENVYNNHKSQQEEVQSVGAKSVTWDTSVVFNRLENDFHVLVIMYDISDIINVKQMQIDFLRNASHELKTPITAISGFTKTLLDGAMDDKKSLVEFLKIIDQQSDQLASLVQDVLTISHIQNGTNYNYKPLGLHDFINSELQSYKSMTSGNHVTINNKIPEHVEVTADTTTLTRILRNLVSNAVKYNRPNGEVNIEYTANDSFWQLHVSDTGIGIAQKDISRLFERFYRADDSRTKQKVSGTGLGLSIVKEMVDAVGGTIDVKSQRGVGSTFTVNFPIVEDDDQTGDKG